MLHREIVALLGLKVKLFYSAVHAIWLSCASTSRHWDPVCIWKKHTVKTKKRCWIKVSEAWTISLRIFLKYFLILTLLFSWYFKIMGKKNPKSYITWLLYIKGTLCCRTLMTEPASPLALTSYISLPSFNHSWQGHFLFPESHNLLQRYRDLTRCAVFCVAIS